MTSCAAAASAPARANVANMLKRSCSVRTCPLFAFLGGDTPTAEALLQLTAALKDQSSYVRKSAANALCEMGPAAAEALPQLLKVLEDQDWQVRRDAAEALAKIGAAAAETLPGLSWSCQRALREMGAVAAEPVAQLINEVEDQDWRCCAVFDRSTRGPNLARESVCCRSLGQDGSCSS